MDLKELPIPPECVGQPSSHEFARLWITKGISHISLKLGASKAISNGQSGMDMEPAAWSILLVDAARHVCRCMAQSGICSEEKAFEMFRKGIEIELSRGIDDVKLKGDIIKVVGSIN